MKIKRVLQSGVLLFYDKKFLNWAYQLMIVSLLFFCGKKLIKILKVKMVLKNIYSFNNLFTRFILKFLILIFIFTSIVNILIDNKNKNFILTEFYYPAVSVESGNVRKMKSLRQNEDLINKFNEKNKVNMIEVLNRGNSIHYLLNKEEINYLRSLNDEKILNFFFQNFSLDSYFIFTAEILKEPKSKIFFHTKNMYSNDHKEKTLEQLELEQLKKGKKLDIENLIKLFSSTGFIKHSDERVYIRNLYRDICPILRTTKSIKLNCEIYPLKLLDQNIEVNFYL